MDAYTIGLKESYDYALATEPVVHKMGREDDYPGGWVWRTADEARKFVELHRNDILDNGEYAVYLIQLPHDWSTDVFPEVNLTDGVHNLLNAAILVGLVP